MWIFLIEKGPGPLAPLGSVYADGHRVQSPNICLYHKYRRSYCHFNEIILDLVHWKLLGVLVHLAPRAMPMAIESKCMSLSQIQKELWPF